MEGSIQGLRNTSSHIRGPWTSRHTAPPSGEFSDYHRMCFFSVYSWEDLKSSCVFNQEYVETAKWIDCLTPLPEGPADALLMEMLVPAPYKVLEKKAEKKATGTRKGLRCKVAPDASS